MQLDGETMETVTDFIFLDSKITADGDCSHDSQYASKFGKLSSGHRTGKGQFSFQSQRRRQKKGHEKILEEIMDENLTMCSVSLQFS